MLDRLAMLSRIVPTVVAVLLLVGTSRAGPVEDAIGAAQRGDHATAMKLMQTAAEQGNASAQRILGSWYLLGLSETDSTEATKWFRLAANQGDAQAQYAMGTMYEGGLGGVKQDYIEAAKWYGLAAAQGDADGQSSLGILYEAGHGVPKDGVQAYKWLTLAAKWYALAAERGEDVERPLGCIFASMTHCAFELVDRRDHVAAGMSSDQIAEGDHLASEWKPNLRP
jgi:TPR repeat protein